MAQKICICGSGTMGSGIALAAAQSGFSTLVYDVSDEFLQKAKLKIEQDLQKRFENNKITSTEKEGILSRLHFTNDINDCKADIVIEAIIEKLDAKEDLFFQLST